MAYVPIQSLIDHIKTAFDVDPWASEMAEKLLKKQEPKQVENSRQVEILPFTWQRRGFCPECKQVVTFDVNRCFCGLCGQAVKWE